jgi:glycine hydroxymethyltransferase
MRVVSGGTDNHIVLVDVSPQGISGKDAEQALWSAGISVNRNTIPFDSKPPAITSGIRMGTPAVTTRGFGTEEMKRIASFIARLLSPSGERQAQKQVRQEVREMCQRFPIPGLA